MNPSNTVNYEQSPQINLPFWLQMLDKVLPLTYDSRVDVAGQLLSGGQSLLDIGAGDSPLIKKYGHQKYSQLAAADLGESLLKKLNTWAKKNNLKLSVYSGDFLTSKINQRFDAITALAYLEHVASPFLHLQKMSSLLKTGGELIVEVPNVAYLLHRLTLLSGKFPITAEHGHCIAGVDEAHLRYFTPSSLKQLLEYCGFEVKTITASGRLMSLRKPFQVLWPDIIIKARKVKSCPKVSPVNQS